MKRKILCESLKEFRLQEGNEPLALAILGAPASGKSFTMDNITKAIKDARIADTISSGVNLTVDKLRDEFKSQNPLEQLKGFARAYYFMRTKAKEDSEEYGGWFNDIIKVWTKLGQLIPSAKITVDDHDLKFQNTSADKNMKVLADKSISPKNVLAQLDKYQDYKRVVRYFQGEKQQQAIAKQYNISYDESGDEPLKIVKGLKHLHDKGYVTDVFLIHPENVASNIIMNYYRVIKGGDGGRDSSDVIIDAYLDIEKNKKYYKFNAEDNLKTTNKQLQSKNSDPKIEKIIQQANVPDDKRRGNKPIDVFTEVSTMKPIEAFNFFNKRLNKEQQIIFRALLKYSMLSIKNLPENAKSALNQITKSINNKQALDILKKAAECKKYIFQYGGITPELIIKAKVYLK